MNFLEKLDFMMAKLEINKSKLSTMSGVPYTTIDTFYKKGYENTKLSTIKKISEALDVSMDYLLVDTITDENYGKTNGFLLKKEEMEHIKKYRILDGYGKEAVDGVLEVEYRRCDEEKRANTITEQQARREPENEPATMITVFSIPYQLHPMSAGTGTIAEAEYTKNLRLVKEPPYGASYVARVSGNSMEPTYYDGDLVFIHSTVEIRPGQVGVFLMDGDQFIKELGDGELISHNPVYGPRRITPDIRCQGLVLGVCDESYFEK